jgi:diaminopimelate decarboxylase
MTRNHDLAFGFGTPIYLYDLDRVTAAYPDLRNSLPSGLAIFYSMKANPHPDIARVLREAGRGRSCPPEVSSVGELAAALEAGFTAEDCLYTGPGKTETELITAIASGVRMFSVESLTDLERMGTVAVSLGAVIDGLLRINYVSSASTSSIRMMGRPSQFGIDSKTLEDEPPKLQAVLGAQLVGAYFYSLRNASDEQSLIDELQQSIATAAMLQAKLSLPMRTLDIGGGFAAPYGVTASLRLFLSRSAPREVVVRAERSRPSRNCRRAGPRRVKEVVSPAASTRGSH